MENYSAFPLPGDKFHWQITQYPNKFDSISMHKLLLIKSLYDVGGATVFGNGNILNLPAEGRTAKSKSPRDRIFFQILK
jgi:hypothetical protein